MTNVKTISRITVSKVIRELRNKGIIVSSSWYKLVHPTDFIQPIKRIRPIYATGHSYSANNAVYIIPFLEMLGVPYEIGNDAPRLGRTGNYIDMSVKCFCEAIRDRTGLDLLKDNADVVAANNAAKSQLIADKQMVEDIASLIIPDNLFKKSILLGRIMHSEAKTAAYRNAFTSLLSRQPYMGDNLNDILSSNLGMHFWPVFRLVKKKALNLVILDSDNTQLNVGSLYKVICKRDRTQDYLGTYLGNTSFKASPNSAPVTYATFHIANSMDEAVIETLYLTDDNYAIILQPA